VRYWAGTSRLGQDTAFSPDLLKIGKKLVGKLWNATAFAAIHLSKMDSAPTTAASDAAITETLDRWILSRLHETVAKATEAFAAYEYADALDATNQFFWADFCDNYLELIKKRVYNEPSTSHLKGGRQEGGEATATPTHPSPLQGEGMFSAAAQQSAVRTLYYVLDGILKLYAPFTPHVTEELYSHIFADSYAAKGSLHANGQWPKAEDYPMDESSITAGKATLHWLEVVRKKKSEANKSIKYPVKVLRLNLPAIPNVNASNVASMLEDLKGAGNIDKIEWIHLSPSELFIMDPNVNFEIEFADEADAA
jgi:valyl-tRNA synthetase